VVLFYLFPPLVAARCSIARERPLARAPGARFFGLSSRACAVSRWRGHWRCEPECISGGQLVNGEVGKDAISVHVVVLLVYLGNHHYYDFQKQYEVKMYSIFNFCVILFNVTPLIAIAVDRIEMSLT